MAVWNTVNQAWGAYGSYTDSSALANIGLYYCVFIRILSVRWVAAYLSTVDDRFRGMGDNKSRLDIDDEKMVLSRSSGNVIIQEV
ncbi:hypothetical protein IAR50_000642 [Cryptococcus sp. DSM 104548]